MITKTLTVRYSPHALREVRAWYIPGSNPADWLDEVTRWDVPHATVRLLPVPRSPSDRQPMGAVVTLKDAMPCDVSQRCVPFGRIGDQLFLPVDGWLEPDVSDAELRGLLPEGYTYVWHPASGLIAFEPSDVLRISDLLTVQSASSCRWDRAQPGVAISRRLVSLAPEATLTIETILEEGQDDIGSEKDLLPDLPPSPKEPESGPFSSVSRHGKRVLASMVRWFTRRVPATSNEPTWINRLEQWAEKHLANFCSQLNAARHREILRLLHLLQTDPDRGLRYALPLGGDAHRGLASPAGRLAERDVNFNLRRLGGGQSADHWDLSADYHYQLTVRYRELANREMHLGRYRRAAYIFAELLADYDAAAGALVEGRHWREAAVLYRQRLNRPMDAARCLEQGGLWTEAIALYDELGEFEKAGDLHVKLGQPDDARKQYRKAVARHRSGGDLLSAARLLEEKLDAVDEAIDVLTLGWPDSRQAAQCVRGVFRMFARHGRHDTSAAWIDRFRRQRGSLARELVVVDVLADTAEKYPDRSVQTQAADCTRAIVSRQLPAASESDGRRLLSAVRRLVPEDRLLGRDCQRYLQPRPVSRKPRAARPRARRKSPTLVHTIQLPGRDISWKKATWCGETIFVAGRSYDKLILARCSWRQADAPGKTWSMVPRLSESPIILAVHPQNDNFVLVHVVGGPVLTTEHVFPPTDECPKTASSGAIRGMSRDVVAAARTAHGITWLVESRARRLTLVAVGPRGEQVSTETVPMPEPTRQFAHVPSMIPVPLHARGETVFVGIVNQMLTFDQAKPPLAVELGQCITSLVGSAPGTRTRVAATFPRGGTVVWDNFEHGHAEAFARDMPYPVACFNRGGYLIAAGEDRCEVYRTRSGRLQLHAEMTYDGSKPIAVLSAPRIDQFGIVSEAGEIAVYAIP